MITSIRRHAVTTRVKQTDNITVAYFNVLFTSCFKMPVLYYSTSQQKWELQFLRCTFHCFVLSGQAEVSGRELSIHILNFSTPVPSHLLIDRVVQSPHLLWGHEKINKKTYGDRSLSRNMNHEPTQHQAGVMPLYGHVPQESSRQRPWLVLRHWPYSSERN